MRRSFLLLAVLVLAVSVVGPAMGATNLVGSQAPSPHSSGVIAAQLYHQGRLRPAAGATGMNYGIGVAGILPNVQASGGGQPTNEVPITADPNNPLHLMSGANDYNCGNIAGFYNSDDGGATWRHSCIGTLPPNHVGCGDPNVAYDLQGRAFSAGIACESSFATAEVVIQTSTNNGLTWSTPTVALPDRGNFQDKEWLEVDNHPASPFADTLYMSNTEFTPGGNGRISVAHSSDHGVTWNSAVVVHSADGSHVDQFSDLATAPNGDVYVSWLNCKVASDCGGQASTMFVSKSTDGGNTWSAATKMADVTLIKDACNCAYYGNLPNTNERMSDLPAVDVDPTNGNVFSVFYNNDGGKMVVEAVESTDGGATWSKPRILAGQKQDQFLPWLSVSSTGFVGVTWLDRRNDTANKKYEAFGVISVGNLNFMAATKIATAQSNPTQDGFNGGFMGDYTGNIWAGDKLYASWPDTRSGVNAQDWTGGLQGVGPDAHVA